ncbi:MAG: hypothetical protein AAB558_02195, partial [Patescibacteria group bacterium]
FGELAAINGMHLQRLTRVKTKIDKPEDKRLMMEFGYLSSLPNESILVIEEANQQGYTNDGFQASGDRFSRATITSLHLWPFRQCPPLRDC